MKTLTGRAPLRLFGWAGLVWALSAVPAAAQSTNPIKIGVIGEESSVAGASLTKAAVMAADDINAHGGVNGRKIEVVTYDDHSSASDAVRAFQRAVSQDKVVAVIGSYISEVVLALEPWSARMRMPFITPGAASNLISKAVHDDYDHYKYTFHGWLTSAFIAQSICDYTQRHAGRVLSIMKTAVVMSEDAAWTTPLDAAYLECLPKAGLKVLDHIRFNPDTADFTPIFHQIEDAHPDVIITGISHVGVQPTVQWHDQQVPIPMAGQSSQATTSSFWKDTNGAAEGVITDTAAAPDVALSPSTIPFAEAYIKKHGVTPAYDGLQLLRHGACDRRSDRARRRLDRSRQAGDRAGSDRSCRHHRPHPVLRPRRPLHSRDEIRTRAGHDRRHPVAGRQAGLRWPADKCQSQDHLPGLHQDAEASTPMPALSAGADRRQAALRRGPGSVSMI